MANIFYLYKQNKIKQYSKYFSISFLNTFIKMGEPSTSFPVFKKATLEDNSSGGNKKRAWKSLKQILATERTLEWPENAVTCKSQYFTKSINRSRNLLL